MRVKKGDLRQSLEVEYGKQQLVVTNEGTQILNFNLSNPINPPKCTYNCGLKKFEIKLAKLDENYSWPSLQQSEGATQAVPMAVQSNSVPQYPTSSKVKKDWSKVDNEIEKDLSKEKPEGDAALNDLFKQIYGRADEATRRAMIKSY